MSTAKFHNFIVHQIIRDSNKYATLKPRGSENQLDDMTNEVGSNLLNLFSKTGLQTGSFGQDSGKPKFEQSLMKHCVREDAFFKFTNFRQMTIDLARILEGKMNVGAGKNANPCYVVFYHHSVDSKSYLTVITLLETKGFTLRNLSFKHIERLDMDKLHLAARIRLDDWEEKIEDRYISFRIGRNSEMRDYFKEFVGCEEFTEAKIETKNLVDAIKYCCNKVHVNDPDKVIATLELAEKFCKTNKDHDGKIDIISLGKHLFPNDDNLLLQVCQSDEYKLSERVSIDNNGLRALVRYRGQDKNMTISFDADLLSSKVVEYDDKTGVLTFNKIPKSLRDSLENK